MRLEPEARDTNQTNGKYGVKITIHIYKRSTR
jgi:hypothetical protein